MAEINPPISPLLRFLTFIKVLVLFTVGAGLLIVPNTASQIWPWELLPFNARFLGAIYAGAVPVILSYPRASALDAYLDQLEALVRHTGATAVFATPVVTEIGRAQMAALPEALRGLAPAPPYPVAVAPSLRALADAVDARTRPRE